MLVRLYIDNLHLRSYDGDAPAVGDLIQLERSEDAGGGYSIYRVTHREWRLRQAEATAGPEDVRVYLHHHQETRGDRG